MTILLNIRADFFFIACTSLRLMFCKGVDLYAKFLM